jgi:hypothetical protein
VGPWTPVGPAADRHHDLLARGGRSSARPTAPPGAAGSIVLVREDGVVFSGDALLSDNDGQVRPPRPRLALDRVQAQASAERIKALPIKLLCTGHGAPVRF